MAKQTIFLQNILWESCGKFYFKQCSLKKFLKILILLHKYMKMCFHSNQHPWATKHPFISLYFKYQVLTFICLPVMDSPIFPSLDDIYCTCQLSCNLVVFCLGAEFVVWRKEKKTGRYRELTEPYLDWHTDTQINAWTGQGEDELIKIVKRTEWSLKEIFNERALI